MRKRPKTGFKLNITVLLVNSLSEQEDCNMSVIHKIIESVPPTNRAIAIPDGPTLNYGQLLSAVSEFEKDLASLNTGLGPQDAVSISLPNSLEYTVAFLAITGSALIAAPLNPAYTQSEVEFYVEDMKSKLILLPQGAASQQSPAIKAALRFGAAVAEVSWNGSKVDIRVVEPYRAGPSTKTKTKQPDSSDIALVLHTSGTTGRPKAVPLLHRNILATVRNIVGTYKLSELDTSYLVMPLFHVHGLMAGLLSPLGSGGTVIIPAKFSASVFWKHWLAYGATWYTAVPTIHQVLLKHPIPTNPAPKIRFVRSCSSSLAPSVFHELEAKLHAPVCEAYAMTEACHQMTSNSLPPDFHRPGTVGVGHGVEVVILDDYDNVLPPNTVGEVSARGPNVTPGYLNNPKANAESFTKGTHYFRTGDQGMIDADGMVVLTGRIKELINRGGEKISPIELDSILLSHPAVSEAVSFGAADEKYGQQVNAVVVLSENKEVSEQELKDYTASKVAAYKVPVKIFFTDVMPKTATGKIQRRIIAQKFVTANSSKPLQSKL